MTPRIVVLDYGSGNTHSACRALARAGGEVELTADLDAARSCAGLVVPGVGAFAAVIAALRAAGGPDIIAERLRKSLPVLGICVGMQVMFESSDEGEPVPGLGYWRGDVQRLPAAVVPHMGWSTVTPPTDSVLFDGIAGERFYFVHSFAAQAWSAAQTWRDGAETGADIGPTWCHHGGPFVAAAETGPLVATQFHPEKSGTAGIHLLHNWIHHSCR